MVPFAIRAEALSKQYTIGHMRGGYDTLREHIVRVATSLTRPRPAEGTRETIWALRDVSFEVEQGEVLGLIGRNGAGKTTLLRLLSRITEPTSGYADIRGRLGSLLEVGTGFHPELTGRENIFLNGAILGMRRSEIARKFDEIVEFSGVEKFIDTPVKRYSSGMYVRLAFSVAAHLELEILLVDEVLAVGDAEFQKRCLGKLDDIGRSGRTVIFVSHSMTTITRLCERVILLDGGRIAADGPVADVVALYMGGQYGTRAEQEWPDPDGAPGNESVRVRSVRVVDRQLGTAETIDVREPVGIEIVFDVLKPDSPPFVPWVALVNEQGMHMFSAMDTDPCWRSSPPPGRHRLVGWIPENLLNEGTITISISLNTFAPGRAIRQAYLESAISFHVIDPGHGDTARGHYAGVWPGPVRPLLEWTKEHAETSLALGRPGRSAWQ